MLFYVIVTMLLASAQAKFWTDCGSDYAWINSVKVSGCAQGASQCVVRKDSDVYLNIDFTPFKNVRSLTAIANGVLLDVDYKLDLPQADACWNHNLSCPLPSYQNARYQYKYWIDKYLLPMEGKLRWELKTDEGERVVCIMLNGRIPWF